LNNLAEWTNYLVEEIASPIANALTGGPFGSNLVSRDYVPSGVPVIRGQNMSSGKWVTGEFAYVSKEKAKQLSRNIARPGDLIFTQRGTLGQVAIVPDRPYDHYIVSQSQMKLTPDKNKADTLFLYYFFSSEEHLEYIRQNTIQTGVPHTNLTILRNTPVTLPPLPTQRRIAQILGRLDDKIEVNRRINRTLEAMAQALYKHWFVDFGPFQDGPFVKSELGLIPEGWRVGTVEQMVELAYGKGLTQKKRIPGPYLVFGSSGEVGTHNDYLIEGPGLIVGRKGTIGRLSWAQENFWPIDTTYYVVPKRDIFSLEYIYPVPARTLRAPAHA
jgi:type I restriction enzyme S subunit